MVGKINYRPLFSRGKEKEHSQQEILDKFSNPFPNTFSIFRLKGKKEGATLDDKTETDKLKICKKLL